MLELCYKDLPFCVRELKLSQPADALHSTHLTMHYE